MGSDKSMDEANREKYEAALQIALAVGFLQECEYHNGCFFEGNVEPEKAYVLAKEQYSENKYADVYRDREEMNTIIKEVVLDHSTKECSSCGHFQEE